MVIISGFEDKHKYFNCTTISQQPYMLWHNCLYCSVQLKMVSLLIWIVWCFEHIVKMAKFDKNTKSIIRNCHQMWTDLGKKPYGNFCANWVIGTSRMRISLHIDWCNWRCDRHFRYKVIAYSMRSTGKTLFQDKTCFIAQWLCSNDFRILCRRLQSRNLWTRPPTVRVCVEWFAGCWQQFYWLTGRVY